MSVFPIRNSHILGISMPRIGRAMGTETKQKTVRVKHLYHEGGMYGKDGKEGEEWEVVEEGGREKGSEEHRRTGRKVRGGT